MTDSDWHIYLEKIPFFTNDTFWVSFESDPRLKKTKANIYGRCLPCIQNLYYQLKQGLDEIALGMAYNCWKVTAVVGTLEDAFSLLMEFEKRRPTDHVYGKLGSGSPGAKTKVVVFHTEDTEQRDLIQRALEECASQAGNIIIDIQISRACAILYEGLFGDWHNWQPLTKIKYPKNVGRILERIKKVLYWME